MRVCFWAAVSTLVALGACQRDSESVRAALSARETAWNRELASIKAQHAAIGERFARQPGATATASPAVARMRARLNGIAQSLVDVEMQVQQVAPRMEPVLARGGDEAEKALEDEGGRMSGYLESLTADVAVAGRELDELRKPAPSSEANE